MRCEASSTPDSNSAALSIGRVKFFDQARAFGFIEPAGGGELFVHGSQVHGGVLAAEDRVEFVIGSNRKNGKPEAQRVRVLR
ncbi:MAG: cold-shock protein [Rhizobiales bacterium]|nr:cold-shock protein [Hyphomicrobiales bacterium]